MRIALDTNRYRDLCDGDVDTLRLCEEADSVHIPFVVLGELRADFSSGTKGLENERTLQIFLAKPGVTILHSSASTTSAYARLYRQLRQQGTPIPTNDLWIAALVVEHDLLLCSRDAHFLHLPQLNVI